MVTFKHWSCILLITCTNFFFFFGKQRKKKKKLILLILCGLFIGYYLQCFCDSEQVHNHAVPQPSLQAAEGGGHTAAEGLSNQPPKNEPHHWGPPSLL